MGIFRNIAEGIKEADRKRIEQDDDKTTDLYLRSLRRQVRRQNEDAEKINLKKEIKEFELKRTRAVVLGVVVNDKTHLIKENVIKQRIKKKREIIQKQGIIREKEFRPQKKKPNIGFFNKANL